MCVRVVDTCIARIWFFSDTYRYKTLYLYDMDSVLVRTVLPRFVAMLLWKLYYNMVLTVLQNAVEKLFLPLKVLVSTTGITPYVPYGIVTARSTRMYALTLAELRRHGLTPVLLVMRREGIPVKMYKERIVDVVSCLLDVEAIVIVDDYYSLIH